MKFLFLITSLTLLLTLGCKKDSFITSPDAQLSVSADSLHFDTVFTSTGSVTQFFRIYNDNDQKLRLSSIRLSGGSGSAFKMNADGFASTEVNDMELEPNDSLYVFVTVKIDPTAANLPFVLQDSISVEYNGNKKWIQLEAWGQNANFFRSRIITSNETWTNTRPYVILGGLLVDEGVTLTIEKGCRLYMHADAPLVVDGTLVINGGKEDSNRVQFRSDRLDEPYRDFPAGWPGIYFRTTSINSVLNYAIIKNAYQGLVAVDPPSNSNPKLTLNETIIDNCYDAGLFALRTSIQAQNCLISNNGKNIILAYGGQYDFNHCTSVAYSNLYVVHKEPVLLATNFIKENENVLTANLAATFRNSVFWGDNGTVEDEVVVSKQGNTVFNVNFQNCLWKVKNNPADITSSAIISNEDPAFDSVNNQKRFYNFRLKDISPALNKGLSTTLSIDLDGLPRPIGLPDLGCYEKQ